MANTYTLIASTTVGSGGAATITFSSIPATYTDLKIVISGRTNRTSIYDYVKMKFNSSATSYSDRNINGNGSTAASETNNSTTYGFVYVLDAANSAANTFGSIDIYIPNYAGSNNKSYSADGVEEDNATGALMALTAGLWSNTAAITTIDLSSATGNNFVQYTTAYLYGIRNS